MVNKNGLILERHNQIINYNGHMLVPETQSVVFEAFITSDERYFVMNDHVIDLQERRIWGTYGSLWIYLRPFSRM